MENTSFKFPYTPSLLGGKKRKKEIKERGEKYPFQSNDVLKPKHSPLIHEPGCRDAVFSRRKEGILLYPPLNEKFILHLYR